MKGNTWKRSTFDNQRIKICLSCSHGSEGVHRGRMSAEFYLHMGDNGVVLSLITILEGILINKQKVKIWNDVCREDERNTYMESFNWSCLLVEGI